MKPPRTFDRDREKVGCLSRSAHGREDEREWRSKRTSRQEDERAGRRAGVKLEVLELKILLVVIKGAGERRGEKQSLSQCNWPLRVRLRGKASADVVIAVQISDVVDSAVPSL